MQIARVGENAFTQQKSSSADLVRGTLVDVIFKAGNTGPGAANHVSMCLPCPWSEFVFRGSLTFLDLQAGQMSIAERIIRRPICRRRTLLRSKP